MRSSNLTKSVFTVSVLLLSIPAIAAGPKAAPNGSEESAIRGKLSQWIEAYKHSDAKGLASLETSNVEVLERFGILHVLSGADENVKLWQETFEVISAKSPLPKVTIDNIQLARPGLAFAHVSWDFPEGILLVDNSRIPAYSQLDTYVLIKKKGEWVIALHNMQEKEPASQQQLQAERSNS